MALFDGVDFTDADLRRADMSDASLCGANLSGIDLRSTNLSGADLTGAIGLTEPPWAFAERNGIRGGSPFGKPRDSSR